MLIKISLKYGRTDLIDDKSMVFGKGMVPSGKKPSPWTNTKQIPNGVTRPQRVKKIYSWNGPLN